MNILKAVLEHEVYPALGCTEPIAVAYAASLAASVNPGPLVALKIVVDPAVYKNGFAVNVPGTGGERGNLIAGVLGALLGTPQLKMEILKGVTQAHVEEAHAHMAGGVASITYDSARKSLFIDVVLTTAEHTSRAIIEGSHTNVTLVELDGVAVKRGERPVEVGEKPYRETLGSMGIKDFVDMVEELDAKDTAFIREGIFMNLEVARVGQTLHKVGYYVADLREKGFLVNDVFSSSKILTASAADARMAGLSYPVMASGGSGNQGIVAILVPYNVGKYFSIPEETIIKSIALSHLVNSYVKCFTGDLSPLCGCAIASGVGAAVALVYQQRGANMEQMTLAVNNVIADLGGMLCDGAKGGCALKVASSTDTAILSAYMAINGHGITQQEGFVGKTAEETIQYLGRIGKLGMAGADDTMLAIMLSKEQLCPN
ncbi:L-serine ammonia-lyase, iron-sulfur-dependent, subunit alpha [Myxococcota bacterium]|nr:L-serine ammonia-lyase, iron-sulfur-dependent, subunit alpha [Myxococcota bacterium]MBU1537731.1 L-serine ammonia-lyase, iron-sulfur-dependent, subunit alpha [Myxococcota bacterium]